jgi:hypothetical protein
MGDLVLLMPGIPSDLSSFKNSKVFIHQLEEVEQNDEQIFVVNLTSHSKPAYTLPVVFRSSEANVCFSGVFVCCK